MDRLLKKPFFIANFRCDRQLDAVCLIISHHLFAGIPFDPSDAREEVPCRSLRHLVLGMYARVWGYGGEHGYSMEVDVASELLRHVDPLHRETVRLDDYLGELLRSIEGFHVIPHEVPPPLSREEREQMRRAVERWRDAGR